MLKALTISEADSDSAVDPTDNEDRDANESDQEQTKTDSVAEKVIPPSNSSEGKSKTCRKDMSLVRNRRDATVMPRDVDGFSTEETIDGLSALADDLAEEVRKHTMQELNKTDSENQQDLNKTESGNQQSSCKPVDMSSHTLSERVYRNMPMPASILQNKNVEHSLMPFTQLRSPQKMLQHQAQQQQQFTIG